MLLLKRGLRRGLLTLRRARGLSTGLLALIGVVAFIQIVILLGFAAQSSSHLLSTHADLHLPVQQNVTDRRVQEFLIAAKALPGVSAVTYVTKEQAYERERAANPSLIGFYEQSNIRNPFHDTVTVTLANFSAYGSLTGLLHQQQWQGVIDPAFLSQAAGQGQSIVTMLTLAAAGRTVAAVLFVIAAAVLLFALVELVRRRALARSQDIFVERISGAQESSIILPFATEAAVMLVVATLLSVGFVTLLLFALPFIIPAVSDGGMFGAFRIEFMHMLMAYVPVLLVLELLLAPILAFGAAWTGVPRTLRAPI